MLQYRREIDGLRALAVLPVILFHAGFSAFAGGFVGVDVFFVISGYLITSILIDENAAGKFSLVSFYERRARRILPALFLVMLLCVPAAWVWLFPEDMREFGDSMAAVSVFSSNILFWQQTNYFAASAELKPLLHTWSLAVEEQYYVFFPLLIAFGWKLGRRWLCAILVAITLASLAATQWGPFKGTSAAFFLLPTRAWELLIGSLAAFWLARGGPRPALTVAQPLAWLGLAMLLFSVVAYDTRTPFPGVYGLVPTIGTALIVLFADERTLVARILAHRALVGVGLVSYSAYLFHQPLFAFARHMLLDDPSPAAMLGLSVASVGLAWVSWRWIERPFRDRKAMSRAAIFTFAIAGSLAFGALGLWGHATNGFESRVSGERGEFIAWYSDANLAYRTREGVLEKNLVACDSYDFDSAIAGHETMQPRAIPDWCRTRDPAYAKAVMIWGDSHAQALSSGLRAALPADWQLLQVAASGCPALLGNERGSVLPYCAQATRIALETIATAKPDVVVVARNQDHDPDQLKAVALRLRELGVPRVVFAGPAPHFRASLPRIVAKKLWGDVPRRTLVGVDRRFMELDARLAAALRGQPGVEYVSLIDYFCNADGCLVYLGDDVKAGLTSYDYGHLTLPASAVLGRDLLAPAVMGSRRTLD